MIGLDIITNNQNPEILNNWKMTPPYHTSIDIVGDKIYSITSGRVIQITHSDNIYWINIQLSKEELIRFGNIIDPKVYVNSTVAVKDFIGIAYKFVKFEYCNLEISKFPVRVLDLTYYKQDPFLILHRKVE